jgi:hypothetical protein
MAANKRKKNISSIRTRCAKQKTPRKGSKSNQLPACANLKEKCYGAALCCIKRKSKAEMKAAMRLERLLLL